MFKYRVDVNLHTADTAQFPDSHANKAHNRTKLMFLTRSYKVILTVHSSVLTSRDIEESSSMTSSL